MPRYVLRFSGRTAPRADQQHVRSFSKVHVVDEAPKMFLIEGRDTDVQELAAALPAWTVAREQAVPLPDARTKARRSKNARG
jgi:hypothetical protein